MNLNVIEKIRERMSPIFEGNDNKRHRVERFWSFIIGMLIWMFVSAAITVSGCVLLFNDSGSYMVWLCTLVAAAILLRPMIKLSAGNKVPDNRGQQED